MKKTINNSLSPGVIGLLGYFLEVMVIVVLCLSP